MVEKYVENHVEKKAKKKSQNIFKSKKSLYLCAKFEQVNK